MRFAKYLQKLITLLLFIVLAVLLGTIGYKVSALRAKKTPVTEHGPRTLPIVFLLPHQDDEMFMAGAMQQALASGREVYVVMVTDGSNSRARHIINGQDAGEHPVMDTVYHYIHRPLREGYAPLDRRMFAEARNKEYAASVAALGVSPGHIWFANPGKIAGSDSPRFVNDQLTTASATDAINQVFKIVGDGTYATVAANLGMINAQHGDHYALREALRTYTGIREKQFFSEKTNTGNAVPLTPAEIARKRKALANYFVWNPKKGRFAVGEHSVLMLLERWSKNPFEYVIDSTDLK